MSTRTPPVWDDPRFPRPHGPLPAGVRPDVLVVGAGIAGLTTAYLLLKEGKSVAVLEAQDGVGQSESAHTTAHLASVIDDRFGRLKSIRGTEAAWLAQKSHAAAIDAIEAACAAERIDCGFRRLDGYLFPGRGAKPSDITAEGEAAEAVGVAVEYLPGGPLPTSQWPCHLPGPCLRFPNQAQFQPVRYLIGLAEAVRRLGGVIATECRVEAVAGGSPAAVTLHDGRAVEAGAVVLATGSPINRDAVLHTKLAAYTTYAIAAAVPRGAIPPALYWDTEDPYHYVRVHSPPGDGPEYLVVGGEDHKTGQATDQQERYDRLTAWAATNFPAVGPVTHFWSGQVFETLDGLAHIGPDTGGRRNVYLATGDSGMGMTHGTVAAILLADLIGGRPSPWADLYAPGRLPVVAARTYLEETANVAAQYTDWVTGGEVGSADQVKPGCGAVMRRGLTKVAVHRADDGEVCELSAVCPHLGGIVRWNPGEGTWDCPAHGSRFAADGRVIHGPAAEDLTRLAARPLAAQPSDG